MKKLIITEEEKRRILNMHKSRILMEQDPNATSDDTGTSETNTQTTTGEDDGFGVNIPEAVQCILEKMGGTEKDLPQSCKTPVGGDMEPDLTKCGMELLKKFPSKALDIASCFGVEGISLPQIPGMPKIPGF